MILEFSFCILSLARNICVNQLNLWDYRQPGVKPGQGFLGTLVQLLFICVITSEGCLSFLCASLRIKIQPKIKGSFLLNCTSASLRVVITTRIVQILSLTLEQKRTLWNRVFRNVFLLLVYFVGSIKSNGVKRKVT